MADLDYRAMCAELLDALDNLLALVNGECPSLLDGDRGGSGFLDIEIDDALTTARALLAQPVVEGPTIPNAKLHRQELTPLEITLLIEALDFAIGDIKARPNSSNHVAVRAKLKRSIPNAL